MLYKKYNLHCVKKLYPPDTLKIVSSANANEVFSISLFSGIAVDEDTILGDIQYLRQGRKNYASRRLSRSVLHVLARTMDAEIPPPNHIGYCKVAILSNSVA